MVSYSEPVVASHDVQYLVSGCELWCVMLSQWFLIMMSYAEPVVAYHGVQC